MIQRRFYKGRSAKPATVIRFLRHLGFRFEPQPLRSACLFHPTKMYGPDGNVDSNPSVVPLPLVLSRPKPGETAIPGALIDLNIFARGFDERILPHPNSLFELWSRCASEVEADANLRQLCLESNPDPTETVA